MSEIRDFIWYVLLKHGRLIIAILGVIVAVMIVMYMQKFGAGVEGVMDNSISTCNEDFDCIEWCGKCVSIAGSKYCEPNKTIECECIARRCVVS